MKAKCLTLPKRFVCLDTFQVGFTFRPILMNEKKRLYRLIVMSCAGATEIINVPEWAIKDFKGRE